MKNRWLFFFIIPLVATAAFAGEYEGLTPGISTKSDADKVFGAPIRQGPSARQYDYSPDGHDLAGLSIRVQENGVIDRIHLIFQDAYAVDQIKEWFDLPAEPTGVETVNGQRVEFYERPGIKIVFAGQAPSGRVIQLTHVGTASAAAPARPAGISADACPAAAEQFAQEADPFIGRDQYAQAIGPLKKAATCDPEKTIYARMLAYAYWKTGDLKNAIATARQVVETTEDYIAYSILGNAYWQEQDCRSAIPYLEKATRYNEDQGRLDHLEFLGVCYYNEGRLNEALTTMVKANKRNRKSPLSVYYLGAISDRLGHHADAMFYYKKYLRLRHDNADMNFAAKERLSVLKRQAGKNTNPSKAFNKALSTVLDEMK